jgi:hypothetical protein
MHTVMQEGQHKPQVSQSTPWLAAWCACMQGSKEQQAEDPLLSYVRYVEPTEVQKFIKVQACWHRRLTTM